MKTIIIFSVVFAALSTILYAGSQMENISTEPAAERETAVALSEPLDSEKLAEIIASGDPGTYLVDVRTEAEYNSGAIPTALNIPYDVIADNLPTEDRSARIIVYCRSGNRSGIATASLEQLGFSNVLDFGAVSNWRGELVVRE